MKLPNVFANKIDKQIHNNCEFCYGNSEEKKQDLSLLKSYFDSNGYVNRLKVYFKLTQGEVGTKLVLVKDDYFVTIDNQKIYFKDIISYDIKK